MQKSLLLIFAFVNVISLLGQPLDEKILEGFLIRNVGPAGMSGRITAIDVVLSEPDHIYIGSASGGVWESSDGGTTWKPIFDDQPSLSIGSIKINQQNPSEIWVGTGEGNPRNSQNSGKGIFRTLDGGKTWMQMGLTETKVIHRILIDRFQPSTIYAGALGSAWGANPERGVFKSVDSGKTWSKILFTNDRSGVADMVMDPENPRKIIAALWEYGRTPWDFNSGGEGSGLYISYDGGEKWKRITSEEGMPKGNLGRIGLAIAPSSPSIVYALVEAKENGLYKSTDGGEHWSLVSTKNIGNRPFYYSELYVDPKNENRIWNLFSSVSKSEDGGRTFESVLDYGKAIHPDHHAFWIHPDDPDYLIDGNDGGLNISRDGGNNWYFCANIPVGQFYHVNVDNDFPFNIYGGMQDNGSWVGPAYVLKSGGIRNNDWRELYFGDGFDVMPRLSDTRFGWAMSQGGNLSYYDRETGFNEFIKPVHPDGTTLRFNWNAALAAVPGSSCGIYFGSQFLHRSDDCGRTWQILSPDLTTNDSTKQKQNKSGGLTIDATSAENNTTILCIAPSISDPNTIWIGTDDGNVQLTRDGGKTWTNLISRMPGFPTGAWIPQIQLSSHHQGEAFVVVNNYRRNDPKPYVFHTMDYGATWNQMVSEKEITSFVQCIIQDPVQPELMFLGADDGLYVSINSGANWSPFPAKVFPRVSTADFQIQNTDHSLVIATFGRSIWVMDNLLPLREIAKNRSVLNKPFVVFPSLPSIEASYRSVDGVRFVGEAEYKGENRSGGSNLRIYVKPAEKKDTTKIADTVRDKKKNKSKDEVPLLKVTSADTTKKKTDQKDKDLGKFYVFNAKGDTIRYINQKLKENWNNVVWDMRQKGVSFPSRREPAPEDDDPSGPYVLPGRYKIVALYNGNKDSTFVDVSLDPRLHITPSDLEARNTMIRVFYKDVDLAQRAFKTLQDVRKDMKMIESLMVNAPDSTKTKIKDLQKELTKKIVAIETKFMDPEDIKGYTNEINLGTYLSSTSSYLNSSLGDPGANAKEMLRQSHHEIEKLTDEINTFLNKDWTEFKSKIDLSQWTLFKKIEPIK
ncbi:MAG TPA: hypothetical protein VFG10_01030 [Saprospiraceae bacterium]|nr:hypothetical protein [Saprospiraceae bacterium]